MFRPTALRPACLKRQKVGESLQMGKKGNWGSTLEGSSRAINKDVCFAQSWRFLERREMWFKF